MGSRRRRGALILTAIAFFPSGQLASAQEQCQFCQDGNMELEDPNRLVYGRTCDRWQKVALGTTAGSVTPCGEFEYVGYLCGCNNFPPSDGCKLCPSGSEILKYPARPAPEVTLSGIPGVATNCEEMRLLVQYSYEKDGLICPVQQSVIASYCGCPDAHPMVCPLCRDRMAIKVGGEAPPFEVETKAGVSVPFTDFSCLDSEYIANAEYLLDQKGCDVVRAQVADKCCVNADQASSSSSASARGHPSVRSLSTVVCAILLSLIVGAR